MAAVRPIVSGQEAVMERSPKTAAAIRAAIEQARAARMDDVVKRLEAIAERLQAGDGKSQ